MFLACFNIFHGYVIDAHNDVTSMGRHHSDASLSPNQLILVNIEAAGGCVFLGFVEKNKGKHGLEEATRAMESVSGRQGN